MLDKLKKLLFGHYKNVIVERKTDQARVVGRTPYGLYVVETPVSVRRVRSRFTSEKVNVFLAKHFGLPREITANTRSFVRLRVEGHPEESLYFDVVRGSKIELSSAVKIVIAGAYFDELNCGIKPPILAY